MACEDPGMCVEEELVVNSNMHHYLFDACNPKYLVVIYNPDNDDYIYDSLVDSKETARNIIRDLKTNCSVIIYDFHTKVNSSNVVHGKYILSKVVTGSSVKSKNYPKPMKFAYYNTTYPITLHNPNIPDRIFFSSV